MAVAWFRNPDLVEGAPLIERATVDDRTFGRTQAKRYPNYVYSVNRNAALMHRVIGVTIDHYAFVGGGSQLGRLKQPAMWATTACGMGFSLRGLRSRTCTVPLPGSILCGRCHGTGPTFPKHAKVTKDGVTRQEANARLGCLVNGYPSVLARDEAEEREG